MAAQRRQPRRGRRAARPRATATCSASRCRSTSRTRPAWSPPATRSRPPRTWPATSRRSRTAVCSTAVDIVARAPPTERAARTAPTGSRCRPAPADAIVGQSGSTLSSNADILVQPSRRLGVVVLLNANPTQLLGLPAGAADIALDVMRLAAGLGPGSSAPPVRSVYLVVDAVLLAPGGRVRRPRRSCPDLASSTGHDRPPPPARRTHGRGRPRPAGRGPASRATVGRLDRVEPRAATCRLAGASSCGRCPTLPRRCCSWRWARLRWERSSWLP